MVRTLTAVFAAGLLALAFWRMEAETAGLAVRQATVSGTPVTVFSDPNAPPGPAVVIAHGFAGSRQLMAPLAVTLARSGYVAVTYDALGHGRNPAPLAGDVTREDGATAALVAELERAMAFARALPEADGRLALAGHSMASDIVVRAAAAAPDVAATVGLSMFSTAVTADAPRNLLVVVGAWEPRLMDEALRVTGLATDGPAAPGVTYGDPATGGARRAVAAPRVEHVGILYSATMLAEARAWLNASFGLDAGGRVDTRGRWIAVWFAAVLALGWALSRRLPRIAGPPLPLARRRFWAAAILPALATPVLAALAPAGLLQVPVADYLSLHFLIYGAVTFAVARRLPRLPRTALLPALGYAGFALAVVYWPLDRYVAAFLPTAVRLPLLAALVVGLLPYFLADETLTRGPDRPRGAYALTKLMFLVSLGIALALDPPRLFFLVLILPVMLLFFMLFGLGSRWSFAATGSPIPAALANAVLFAWAIAVTFPILAA